MAADSEELLRDVESVKNIMVARATGEATSSADCRELRMKLVKHPVVSKLLPRVVHTCRTLDEFWGVIKQVDRTYAGRRTHLAQEFDPVLTHLEQAGKTPADSTTGDVLRRVDSADVHELWQRAIERRTSDPQGAITLARTLLEAVCKHILDESGTEYDDKADLPKLYSLVASNLNLSPAQHIEPIFRQILGGCHSGVQGLGSLRSRLGDAHAQGKVQVKPAPRHAELAVNLAGTMATFLLATWEARGE